MTLRCARWRSEAGGALVELAITLPVLLLVFAGAVDFARVFYTSMSLTDAARAGAQYGSYNASRTGQFATMEATAVAATNTTGVTAVASRLCQCASNAGVFTPTATPNDCVSPVATSCPGGHRVITVTVTTSKVVTTIMNGFIPVSLQSLNISRTATMRVHQ